MAKTLIYLGFPIAGQKGSIYEVFVDFISRLFYDLIDAFLGGSVQSIESFGAVGEEDFVVDGFGYFVFEISHHGIGNGVVFHFKDPWPMR